MFKLATLLFYLSIYLDLCQIPDNTSKTYRVPHVYIHFSSKICILYYLNGPRDPLLQVQMSTSDKVDFKF